MAIYQVEIDDATARSISNRNGGFLDASEVICPLGVASAAEWLIRQYANAPAIRTQRDEAALAYVRNEAMRLAAANAKQGENPSTLQYLADSILGYILEGR